MESGDSADSRVSRREMMTLAGTGAVGAVAIGGGSMVLSNTASATAQLEAEDLEVTAPDGKVEEINIIVSGAEITYSNVGPEVVGCISTIYVDGEEVASRGFHKHNVGEDNPFIDIGPDSGTIAYHSGIDKPGGPGVPLFSNTSYEPSDFEVSEDGASETYTLDVEVEFGVYTDEEESGDGVVVTDSGSDTVELTITNEDDGSSGGGGTGGGSDPDPEISVSGGKISLTVELPDGSRVTS